MLGLGLNAYFTYTVVGYHGSGLVPYEVALTAVFVEGFVFFGLTLIGMRQWLARAIPHSIKLATGVSDAWISHRVKMWQINIRTRNNS